MKAAARGFTLIEMLVGIVLSSVIVGVALSALMMHNRTHAGQNLNVEMEQNLRVGMGAITDALRAAGYGVPGSNLGSWIPSSWISGFAANPTIATNEIKVARCTALPVVTLSVAAVTGASVLSVTSAVAGKTVTDLLNTGNKRLIFIGDSQNAHVKTVAASLITIDTDPTIIGNQGTTRAFPAGTPACRVDVLTFKIENDPSTGIPQLKLNENQGAGALALAEGITTLNVTTVQQFRQYTVTLTGRTEDTDPMMDRVLTRSLVSDVTLRNAL